MTTNPSPEKELARERVVVFGGLGFIGSHVCRELLKHCAAVKVFDRPGGSRESVKDIAGSLEIVDGDISNTEDVIAALRNATVLVNLVHTTVPGSSMKDPGYDVVSNVASTVKWLERLKEIELRRIIYLSSGGTVYGVPEVVPITEDHPTNPISSYGITKLAIEKYTALYANRFGVDYRLIRPSNVYGPGQQLHQGQGVIGILAQCALNGEPLDVWGTGTAQRDYLFVDDLVEALLKLLVYQGPQNVFNVSSGTGHSVLDLIDVLNKEIDPLPQIVHRADRGFDVPINVLDSGRLRQETGWRAQVDFEAGVRRTIQWLKER
jgi:UDP-glucose 4-epimerase